MKPSYKNVIFITEAVCDDRRCHLRLAYNTVHFATEDGGTISILLYHDLASIVSASTSTTSTTNFSSYTNL